MLPIILSFKPTSVMLLPPIFPLKFLIKVKSDLHAAKPNGQSSFFILLGPSDSSAALGSLGLEKSFSLGFQDTTESGHSLSVYPASSSSSHHPSLQVSEDPRLSPWTNSLSCLHLLTPISSLMALNTTYL